MSGGESEVRGRKVPNSPILWTRDDGNVIHEEENEQFDMNLGSEDNNGDPKTPLNEQIPTTATFSPVMSDQMRQQTPLIAGVFPTANPAMYFTPENTIWDVYNNEARIIDAELVKDWTSSLNFLLLFAAIFSSILTAFIIESKKMLEQDPSEVMKDVLIFYTNNLVNGTHTPYKSTTFSPPHWAVIVNCLFFASLSASIVTALASVIALQWVAEYDAAINRGGASPKDRVKRRQFRFGGVVKWRMNGIIATLPILLYFSVAVFFAGLVEWMWNIHIAVGYIVLAGAVLATLFYVASTIIAVFFPSSPFRSPPVQWIHFIFHVLSTTAIKISRALHLTSLSAFFVYTHFTRRTLRARDNDFVQQDSTLAFDALVWLATHISISPDSYRRFALLAREMLSFSPRQRLNRAFQGIPWQEIFNIVGSNFLTRALSQKCGEEDIKELILLIECLRDPQFGRIIAPGRTYEYLERKPSTHADESKASEKGEANKRSREHTNTFYWLVQTLIPSLPVDAQLRHRFTHIHRATTTDIPFPRTDEIWKWTVQEYEGNLISRNDAIRDLAKFLLSAGDTDLGNHIDLFLLSLSMGYPISHHSISIPSVAHGTRFIPYSSLVTRLQALDWINHLQSYPKDTLVDILCGLLPPEGNLALKATLRRVRIRDILRERASLGTGRTSYATRIPGTRLARYIGPRRLSSGHQEPPTRDKIWPLWRFITTDEEVAETLDSFDTQDHRLVSELIQRERKNLRLVEALTAFDKLQWRKDPKMELYMVCIIINGLVVEDPSLYDGYLTPERKNALRSVENPCLRLIACACAGIEWDTGWNSQIQHHDGREYNDPLGAAISFCFNRYYLPQRPISRFLLDPSTIWKLRTQIWQYLPQQLQAKIVREALEDIDVLKNMKDGFKQPSLGIQHGGDYLLSAFHSALRDTSDDQSKNHSMMAYISALLNEKKAESFHELVVSSYSYSHLIALCREVRLNPIRLMRLLIQMLQFEENFIIIHQSLHIMKNLVAVAHRYLVKPHIQLPPLYCQQLVDSICRQRNRLVAVNVYVGYSGSLSPPLSLWDIEDKSSFLMECTNVVHGLLSSHIHSSRCPSAQRLSCARATPGYDAGIGWLGVYMN